MNSVDSSHGPGSSKLLVVAAWLFVGVPLAWGVYQTGYQSLGLFRATSANSAPTTAPR